MALVDQEVDVQDLILVAPSLAPLDLLLKAFSQMLVDLDPYFVHVPQSRLVWNGNIAMLRLQLGFKRHSH